MLVDKSGRPVASVVIPAYNSKATIAECLDALIRQETNLPYEIIVVESSGDGAGDVVRRRFPLVRLIESPERLYAGSARNMGAEEASGEILLFIDSDCIAEPTWISRMWHIHYEWNCAAVAGSILNANPESPISVASYMNEFSHFFPTGKLRYMSYLPSGNLSYKIDVFREYGGFDPSVKMYEDLIFNKTLSRAGEKLVFAPEIRVAHNHRTELREYLAHEFRRGRGAAAARRMGLLIGASCAKYPILGFLALPGLFLRKAAVFPYRLLRAYPSDFRRVVGALPYFYLALLIWHYGFISEVVSPIMGSNADSRVAECTTN